MSEDSVMYDTPLEFVTGAVQRQDECAAQSVIPRDDGTYACGCSCNRWEATASSLEEGLRLAREHTGTTWPAEPASADPAEHEPTQINDFNKLAIYAAIELDCGRPRGAARRGGAVMRGVADA
jgi:hypothetical protein